MGPVPLLVGSSVRRHWRSLVVTALLLGLVGAVVMSALAGARRTESAYPRLLDSLLASDASVEVGPEYFAAITRLPQVEVAAPLSFLFVTPEGLQRDDLSAVAGVDERFNAVVDRPLMLAGRLPLPDRVNEVFLNEELADALGVQVGSRLALSSLTPAQVEALIVGEDPGEPAGPRLDVTVTGVGRTQEELANRTPIMVFTPAFYVAHQEDIGHFDDILQVRLSRGVEDLASFQSGVHRVVPEREGAIVETGAETSAKIQDATRVQAASLVIFAIAAALAGFVAIGQALARQIARATADQLTLHALGLSRWQRFEALLVPVGLVAIAGAGMAVGAAILASPVLPTGFARRVEPDPGFAADWLVLGGMFAAVVILVSGPAALSAWRTSGRLRDAPIRRDAARLTAGLARLGAPVSVQTGVRMAIAPGRGASAVPVRSALAGAVVGVAGLVAALTFGAALLWVVTEPAAYGMTWDTTIVGPSDEGELRRDVAALAEDTDIRAVAALSVVPMLLGGEPVQSYGLELFKGGSFVAVLDGRLPQGADEVVVGSETLERLGRQVGDTLSAAGLEGGVPTELTIVGRGVFPEFIHPAVPDSDTGAYNDFALLTEAGNEPFADDAGGEYFSLALVRWAAGVDPSTAARRFEGDGTRLEVVTRPTSFDNLARVDAFPPFVAAFLVLVAMLSTGHAVVLSVRRRAQDLALLKTFGFVGSQVRATVAWQATTFAAIGLAAGIPAGLVVGRVAWALVADRLGIDLHIPIPWLAIALAVPASLLLANLLAALPGRRAAFTRPAVLLRSE